MEPSTISFSSLLFTGVLLRFWIHGHPKKSTSKMRFCFFVETLPSSISRSLWSILWLTALTLASDHMQTQWLLGVRGIQTVEAEAETWTKNATKNDHLTFVSLRFPVWIHRFFKVIQQPKSPFRCGNDAESRPHRNPNSLKPSKWSRRAELAESCYRKPRRWIFGWWRFFDVVLKLSSALFFFWWLIQKY